ncbi:hypothetical protein [Kutzneria albida]|uniref:Uncharacterized protein n=1 Tax=Kutzneria albida DSM 43870 TaxID=1449976 RepID=W5WBM6_9PSEU|nr:hypothetical protein [Kutzneria albida]AHH98277.1 hypothetical protein KALB_4915 [Kutzneria albida DSM 43870]
MTEQQWIQAADQHGVPKSEWPLILDLARIQLDNLQPAVAAGVVTPPGSIWEIATELITQHGTGEPRGPEAFENNFAPDIRWADA